jgi:coenzyme F420-reducing hydrogenase beta subunit
MLLFILFKLEGIIIVIDTVKNCTGCACCAIVCSTKCIEIELDNDGFYHPVIRDLDKCTKCNLCEKICPVLNNKTNNNTPKAYSVVSKNKETLRTTSSGGASFEIAKSALLLGYKVCAAVYNYEKHITEHIIISNNDKLEATKGSKYMQSYTLKAFERIFDGSKYIVFGTPCQIAGVENIATMRNMRDNFILVDFFCHGTPSMKLWKKYIDEMNKKEINKIYFRSKEYGWHTFSLKFKYKDNTSYSDANNNLFYSFFLGNYCLNNSCYECSYKALNSAADIRVGDFWGKKYIKVDTGVSGVLAFNDLAIKLIENLKNKCIVNDETIADTIDGQMSKSPVKSICRKHILKSFDKNVTLDRIFKIDLFPSRLIDKVKSIIKI